MIQNTFRAFWDGLLALVVVLCEKKIKFSLGDSYMVESEDLLGPIYPRGAEGTTFGSSLKYRGEKRLGRTRSIYSVKAETQKGMKV